MHCDKIRAYLLSLKSVIDAV